MNDQKYYVDIDLTPIENLSYNSKSLLMLSILKLSFKVILISMALVYGTSSLLFDSNDHNIFYAGVGPYFCIYQNDICISQFLLFPSQMRISNIMYISTHNSLLLTAENILKIIKLNNDYQTIDILQTKEYPDWIIYVQPNGIDIIKFGGTDEEIEQWSNGTILNMVCKILHH